MIVHAQRSDELAASSKPAAAPHACRRSTPSLPQEQIKAATAYLKQASQQPVYGLHVLKVRRRRPAAAAVATRRLAAWPGRQRPLCSPIGRIGLCNIALASQAVVLLQPTLCCPPSLSPPAQLITLESVPVEVRQAAAVNFKNFVKYHWVSETAILASAGWKAGMCCCGRYCAMLAGCCCSQAPVANCMPS